MSTRSSSDTNVHIDEDGFNKMIKWTFVGKGREKSDSFHSKESVDRYSGITDMRKKEERIQPCFSFADRSHVTLPSMSNFIAYQKMIRTDDA